MGRKSGNRKIRKTIAVLGDGQTEHFYLKHLKRIKGYGYKVSPSLFNRCTLEDAERFIDGALKGELYNKIFYFTDYDTVVNQKTKEKFKLLKRKYKNEPIVEIIETMPSLEFWFLLHFQYTTRPFRNAEEVEKVLKKHIPDYDKSRKFLEQENWVKELCNEGKLEEACKHATQTIEHKEAHPEEDHSPFSKVHLALEEFEKQRRSR
jgi:hypothetical protein